MNRKLPPFRLILSVALGVFLGLIFFGTAVGVVRNISQRRVDSEMLESDKRSLAYSRQVVEKLLRENMTDSEEASIYSEIIDIRSTLKLAPDADPDGEYRRWLEQTEEEFRKLSKHFKWI